MYKGNEPRLEVARCGRRIVKMVEGCEAEIVECGAPLRALPADSQKIVCDAGHVRRVD